MRAIKLLGFVAGISVCLCTPPASHAAYFTDWTASDVFFVSDPANLLIDNSQDILGFYYRQDLLTHYFRVDLRGAPVQASGQFAPEYSIQINDATGGGAWTDTGYIADPLTGIDHLLTAHYTLATGWSAFHLHTYDPTNGPSFVDTLALGGVGGFFDFSEPGGGGSILQWSIPKTALPAGPFVFVASAQDIGVPTTFDVTAALNTTALPEPGTFGLAVVAMGCGALVMRLRRRRAS